MNLTDIDCQRRIGAHGGRITMRQLVLASLAMLAAPATGALASSADVDPERRVESILSRMTLEEKIDLLGGENTFGIRGVPRLGVPAMLTADGPFGVRTF